jgi:hypothetical protein
MTWKPISGLHNLDFIVFLVFQHGFDFMHALNKLVETFFLQNGEGL